MKRSVFVIISTLLVVSFMSAIVLLMIPVQFNSKWGQKTCMQTGWMNLVCKIPSPNLNVTQSELTTYWKLPKNVRLSPSMIKVGRCKITINKGNEMSLLKMKYDVCYCGYYWWVPVIAATALFCGVFSCAEFIAYPISKDAKVTVEQLTRRARYEMFRHLVIIGSLFFFTYGQANDFSYTLYGDLFPSLYFDGFPTAWEIAMWLYISGGIMQAAYAYGLTIFVKWERCKQEERAVEAKTVPKSVPVKKMGQMLKNQGNDPNGTAEITLKDETVRQDDQPKWKAESMESSGEQPIKLPPLKVTFNKDTKDSVVAMFQLPVRDNENEQKVITEDSEKEKTGVAVEMNEGQLNKADPKNA